MTTTHNGMPLEQALGRLHLARGGDATDYARERHVEMLDPVVEAARARYFEKAAQWGFSHEQHDNPDKLVEQRLQSAVIDLFAAIEGARSGPATNLDAMLPEIRKRAADVVNQTLFAADIVRLRNSDTRP